MTKNFKPRKYLYLDRAIMQYARENNCSIEFQDIVLIMGCIEARNHCMFIIIIMEIRCLILITYILETSYMRNIRTYLIEDVVKTGQPVYLTKNGYGSMVVLSLDAYSRLTDDVEYALDAADRQAKKTDVRYTHEEMFSKLRGTTNG